MYMFWQRDDAWVVYGPLIFAGAPAAIRPLIKTLDRGRMLRDLHGQVCCDSQLLIPKCFGALLNQVL
jgi:hypothetical protein